MRMSSVLHLEIQLPAGELRQQKPASRLRLNIHIPADSLYGQDLILLENLHRTIPEAHILAKLIQRDFQRIPFIFTSPDGQTTEKIPWFIFFLTGISMNSR